MTGLGSCGGDIAIIGAGIVGLSIAFELSQRNPELRVIILEKEGSSGAHASGRNSGVLHAGFYYTSDSLKAKLTAEGNRLMRDYCLEHGLPLLMCGKLVVAQSEEEVPTLKTLQERGESNGAGTYLVSEQEAREIEPHVRTIEAALYSPETGVVDPVAVCKSLEDRLRDRGVEIRCDTKVVSLTQGAVETTTGTVNCRHIINAAGLYADTLARMLGFSARYEMLPFKGCYLGYTGDPTITRGHVYPIPDLRNPFLGVHFTKRVDGGLKIGPTATPAFWREQYDWTGNFQLGELVRIVGWDLALFLANSFGFRALAFEELRKYRPEFMMERARRMIPSLNGAAFDRTVRPGIRAQLLDTTEWRLVTDFVIEGDEMSTHILNAVSPAFTCAFSFARLVVSRHLSHLL